MGGLEEFGIEKFRLVNSQKEKIRQEYSRKTKQEETQMAIARSLAINKSRLMKITERQKVLGKISDEAQTVLKNQLADGGKSKAFITKLIVQGALMLLEDAVAIKCRQSDVQLVESCLAGAAAEYSQVIKSESGAAKSVKFTVNKSTFLPPPPTAGSTAKSCLGGVILSCQNGTITIDNTVDARLQNALDQD